VSFFVGLAVSVTFWLFPDSGKRLIERFGAESQPTVAVPGQNAIERRLNLAKMEGVAATTSSTEFAVAIPFARPSLTQEGLPPGFTGSLVALSNASPIRSENQDLVFSPGKCRFLGLVHWSRQPALIGAASITLISCVLDNGDSYELGTFEGAEIGFLTPVDKPANKDILLVEEGNSVSLPKDGKYTVRFLAPLRDLVFKGKSAVTW
jgi:hypothetical protein